MPYLVIFILPIYIHMTTHETNIWRLLRKPLRTCERNPVLIERSVQILYINIFHKQINIRAPQTELQSNISTMGLTYLELRRPLHGRWKRRPASTRWYRPCRSCTNINNIIQPVYLDKKTRPKNRCNWQLRYIYWKLDNQIYIIKNGQTGK